MRPHVLSLAALALWACAGEEGSLTLRLVQAPFDEPFRDLETFQVLVLDEESKKVERFIVAAEGDAFDLGLVSSGARRVEIYGLADERVISQGWSRLMALEQGVTGEELVPYATTGVGVALPAERARHVDWQVDGALDDWTASPAVVLGEADRVSGPELSATDLRVELMLAWEQGMFHFALQVTDECPALVEGQTAGTCSAATATERVFLGFAGGDDTESYGAGDLWIEIKATQLWVRQGTLTPAQIAVVVAPRADRNGWVMEGSLDVVALARTALDSSVRLGVDLIVVDEDPGQAEPSVVRWSKGSHPTTSPTPLAQMPSIGFGAPDQQPAPTP